jgi:hypothetical protein
MSESMKVVGETFHLNQVHGTKTFLGMKELPDLMEIEGSLL